MRPFIIDVAQAQLDDLQRRLESTRWPAQIEGAGRDYGTDQGPPASGHRTVDERI